MKKLVIALALTGAAFGCKSQSTEVTDTSAPVAAESAECAAACDATKAECTDAAKAECATKVCPVTGKQIN
jgi:hypothetical protein